MEKLHTVSFILLVIGGLNWLLTAFGWGIGNYIPASVAMVVYILVGLSAIYEVATHKQNCMKCSGMASKGSTPAAPGQPGM